MKTRSGQKVKLTSYDELLAVPTIDGAMDIPLDQLHEFKNHPFHVMDDEAMEELVESIKKNGILSPAIARKRPEGGYELISGHRRKHAAELAGLEKMPVFVKELTDDEATIIMVDANIQREEILPSERAFAFKMKMEALSHQGVTSGHDVPKLDETISGNSNTVRNGKLSCDIIGEESGISGRQVERYIRLTELIPELLDLVDNQKISFVNGVELSFLSKSIQQIVLDYIKKGKKLVKEKIAKLRKIEGTEEEQIESVNAILYEVTGTVKQVYFSLTDTQIASYFPKEYSRQQMEEVILTLLDQWSREQGV